MLYRLINKLKLKKYLNHGLKIGENFSMQSRVHIDSGFAYLIEIGNNVTLAPEVMILAHDASAKKNGGYTSIGKVKIGDNVFIGAKTIVLEDVTIGNNVIIGAGSVVTKNIPSNSVACGNPAKVIKKNDEFIKKNRNNFLKSKVFEKGMIQRARKNPLIYRQITDELENGEKGFINEN